MQIYKVDSNTKVNQSNPKQAKLIDKSLTGTATPHQSEPGSNDNKEVTSPTPDLQN